MTLKTFCIKYLTLTIMNLHTKLPPTCTYENTHTYVQVVYIIQQKQKYVLSQLKKNLFKKIFFAECSKFTTLVLYYLQMKMFLLCISIVNKHCF